MEAGSKEWYGQSGIYPQHAGIVELPPLADARHKAFFERVKTPGTLLDLGCGDGTFLRHAQARGFEVTGVEFQDELASRARNHGLAVVVGDLREVLADGAKHYDFITAFDVLEHLEQPVAVARQMLSRLQLNGVVAITVPNAARKPRLFNPVIDTPPHHLTLWTKLALEELFKAAGAASFVVSELPVSTDDLYLHHIWKRHGHGASRADRLDGLVRRKLAVQVAAGNALGLYRGHTLIALAQSR